MRSSDWSSDVCSADLLPGLAGGASRAPPRPPLPRVAAGGGGGGWREAGASVILGGPAILDGPIILLDRHPRPGPAIRTDPLDPDGQSLEYTVDGYDTLHADSTDIVLAPCAMTEGLTPYSPT